MPRDLAASVGVCACVHLLCGRFHQLGTKWPSKVDVSSLRLLRATSSTQSTTTPEIVHRSICASFSLDLTTQLTISRTRACVSCRAPCRQLLRNISSNSSYANNHPRDDTAAEDDRQQQTATSSDVRDISYGDGMSIGAACTSSVVSLRSSPCISFDSMQPHVHNAPVTLQHAQADCPQLLLGTNSGLFQLDLATLQVQRLGLTAVPVGHVSYSSCGLVLAACPVSEDTCYGGSPQAVAEAKEAAGLYCLNLKQRRSCDSSSPSSFGNISCDLPVLKVWHGGAT